MELTYAAFAEEYTKLFGAMLKYTLNEIGSEVYGEKLMALGDAYPEFLEAFEAEVEYQQYGAEA